MRKRNAAAMLLAALSLAGLAPAKPKRAPGRAAAPVRAPAAAGGVEKRLVEYAALYLAYDPDTKITVGKSDLKLPGFTAWRIQRTGRFENLKADAAVTIVEYADMECQYCRFRGRQLDKLLAANAGVASVRRHYKFFPLWSHHAWSMKAASAGDCLFRLAGGPSLFRFKELVYGRQENLSVSAIDELAITSAEGEGVSRSDYLACYLRDDSFDRVRKDMEEGYRLGVNSTPTYFVDGTQINWVEDKVMEDFLRTKFPRLKTIAYER